MLVSLLLTIVQVVAMVFYKWYALSAVYLIPLALNGLVYDIYIQGC